MFRSIPSLGTLVAACLLPCVVVAQTDENQFKEEQSALLNAFAQKAYDKGFYRQAKLIWLQSIKLYDRDSDDAHAAIGELRVGQSWQPDPNFEYPEDDEGSGADGQRLFKDYERLKSKLASNHKRQAKRWDKAGNPVRAKEHYRMVLRWDADDKQAQEALEHRPVGGVTGTELGRTIYENSKKIKRAVATQSRVDYDVEPYSVNSAPLDRAQVKYVSFQSEHFVLHGDPERAEVLQEALRWGERAVRICEVAFPWQAPSRGGQAVARAATTGGRFRREFAYFSSEDTFKQILKAHADRFDDLAWRLENTSSAGVDGLGVSHTRDTNVTYDAIVRDVAQAFSGFGTSGLREGIGHTFVGMVFNQNHLFSVAQKKLEGTTASEEELEYVSPNFDVWKNLALEMAWKLTGSVSALDLAYVRTASFTNEERIKAWSFCDYMVRRDPSMLLALDRLALDQQTKGIRIPLDLRKKFSETTETTLEALDKEWEDFWTEATPVLAAIRNNTPPLSAVSKGAERWLSSFNEARKAADAPPVNWSSDLSTRCLEHCNYLIENKSERGFEAEHMQKVELGGSHLGSMFAQSAIVEVGAKPGAADKLFQQWLLVPGYRDALVHGNLRTIGLYYDKGVLVMNVVQGLGIARAAKDRVFHVWPRQRAKAVPRSVEVRLLGPDVEARLEAAGRGRVRKIGYPLSLHFGTSVQGDVLSYQCSVSGRDGEVDGFVISEDAGRIRQTSAPGLVTFYPYDELPSGEIQVSWTWKVKGEVRNQIYKFTTQ